MWLRKKKKVTRGAPTNPTHNMWSLGNIWAEFQLRVEATQTTISRAQYSQGWITLQSWLSYELSHGTFDCTAHTIYREGTMY